MRKPLLVANWKMNQGVEASLKYIANILHKEIPADKIDVALCPPYTSLYSMGIALAESDIMLGAQNCNAQVSGAFTGEISCDFLREVGCEYVIVGHSERRKIFNESDESIRDKVDRVLQSEMVPILCIGETEEERQDDKTFHVIKKQLRLGFQGLDPKIANRVVIAYEPVWAIGTGNAATAEQAEEVHQYIRNELGEILSSEAAQKMTILYGGSVKTSNIKELMACPNIDGGLVGGASLDVDDFVDIITQSIL